MFPGICLGLSTLHMNGHVMTSPSWTNCGLYLVLLLWFCGSSEAGFGRGNVPLILRGPQPPSFNIPVSTPVGTEIYQFQTSVPDSRHLEYSLNTDDQSALEYFSINNVTGVLTLQKQLDIQKHPNFKLVVTVDDGELKSRSPEIQVRVRPDNENTAPIHRNQFVPSVDSYLGNFPFSPPRSGFGPQSPQSPSKPEVVVATSVEEKTSPPTQTQYSFAAPVTKPAAVVGPPLVATIDQNGTPNWGKDNRIVNHELEWKLAEARKKAIEEQEEEEGKQKASGNLRYLGLLALLVPACVGLWLWKRCRHRDKHVKEKLAVVKSISADTGQSVCKMEDKLTVLSETPSTALKKSLLAPTWSNSRYPYRRKSGSSIAVLQNASDGYLQPDVPIQVWEVSRERIRTLDLLGEGCFGQVFKAEAKEPSGEILVVAVKTLKYNAVDKEKRDLLNELELMKTIENHPNVVQLLGCCTIDDPIFVIMEYVAQGKLLSVLRRSRNSHYYGNLTEESSALTSHDLTSFSFQVARGMEYLSKKGILHRDLAARNILVDHDLVCKVSDFGLARDIIDNHIYERKSEGRLPIRWMAPESLFDNIFTTKSDVWSFGVLTWEIATLGSTPYPGIKGWQQVMEKIRKGDRLEQPTHCKRELYHIMFSCWEADPDRRPSFAGLVDDLGTLLGADQDYLDLNNFPENTYENSYPIMTSETDEKL